MLVGVPFLQARGAKVTLLGCGAELFTAGVPVPRPSLAVLGEEVHSRSTSRRKIRRKKKINQLKNKCSPITAGLLPVEWVALPDAAPLHGPLEDAGDHGVVGLVGILQHLRGKLAGEVRGSSIDPQPLRFTKVAASAQCGAWQCCTASSAALLLNTPRGDRRPLQTISPCYQLT